MQRAENSNLVLFQYQSDKDYGWKKFNPLFSDSPKIKHWSKDALLKHFSVYDVERIIEKNKILAGFMVIRNTPASRSIMYEWLSTMLYFPHLVVDPLLHEIDNQRDDFAQHRHDQSVISIIARIFEQKGLVTILDEDFESDRAGQALLAARRTVQSDTKPENFKLKNIIRRISKK